MKNVIKIVGLDCAACAAELEEIIRKIKGVRAVSVSFVSETVAVDCESQEVLQIVKETVNGFEEVKVVERKEEKLIKIANLHCANCATFLEEDLRKIVGVESVSVDYLTETVRLVADSDETVKTVLKTIRKFDKVKVLNEDEIVTKSDKHLPEIIEIALGGLFFFLGLLFEYRFASVGNGLPIVLYLVGYFSVGFPVLISTAKNVIKGKIFDENFLMTLASVGAFALREYSEGVAVMLLYALGELLEGIAVGASRGSIAKLMDMKSERAERKASGVWQTVRPEELIVGDRVRVATGEKIPCDGKLESETALLDVKSLTGESEPKRAKTGDEVLSGAINVGEMLELTVIREFENSTVHKILELVENSSAKKANPEKFITKFSKIYTPIVCALALVVAFAFPLLYAWINGKNYSDYFATLLKTALNFLVISCPCALIISVPLSYFSGIGACAKHGILVKGATYLDDLSKADVIAFDKTGTLTEGNFSVRKLHPKEVTEKELNELIAYAESPSKHPIALAFSKTYSSSLSAPKKWEEIAGKGISCEKDGKVLLVGSEKLMKENGIETENTVSPYTLVFVAYDGKYLGYAEVGDTLRPNVKSLLRNLKKSFVKKTVMLTGDRTDRAVAVANEIALDEVFAELLPQEKPQKATQIKEDGKLVYVGDGINDAPVMTVADVAISMGKLGSAAAVEASDLVLITDDLSSIEKAFSVAHKTRRIVTENILFSIFVKLVVMILSLVVSVPISLAVFADVGVMLIAVLNSMRIRLK